MKMVRQQNGQMVSAPESDVGEKETMQFLRATYCKGLGDTDIKLFMKVCAHKGLDPFCGQVVPVVRRYQAGGQWQTAMSIQTTIDGFRSKAAETGEMDGYDGPYWCDSDGQWLDVWLRDEPPAAARMSVYRRGQSRPYAATVRWRDYVQTGKDGKPSAMWKTMGPHMLAKCAEALALRMGFPQQLEGLHSEEEMARERPELDALPHTTGAAPEPPAYVDALAAVQSSADLDRVIVKHRSALQSLNDSQKRALQPVLKRALKAASTKPEYFARCVSGDRTLQEERADDEAEDALRAQYIDADEADAIAALEAEEAVG